MPVVQMENQSGEETPRGFDNEFYEILKSNLGQQAMGFYRTLNGIKDTLVKRGMRNNAHGCSRSKRTG